MTRHCSFPFITGRLACSTAENNFEKRQRNKIVMRATENKWCGVQMCTGLSVVFYTGTSVWSVCIVSHVAACAFVMDQVSCSFFFPTTLPTPSEHPCTKKALPSGVSASCPTSLFLRAVCWWRAIAPHSQWSEAASEKDAILFNLAVGFLMGVLERDNWLGPAWIMIRAVLSLARCCQLFLHILARRSAITSLSVGPVAKCIVALFVGHQLSRHACLLFPSRLFRAPEPFTLRVNSSCGPCVGGERLLHKVSGQRRPVKTVPSSLTSQLGGLVGVCSSVTVCCPQRGSSRDNVVSAKQFRSLPESLRSDSR